MAQIHLGQCRTSIRRTASGRELYDSSFASSCSRNTSSFRSDLRVVGRHRPRPGWPYSYPRWPSKIWRTSSVESFSCRAGALMPVFVVRGVSTKMPVRHQLTTRTIMSAGMHASFGDWHCVRSLVGGFTKSQPPWEKDRKIRPGVAARRACGGARPALDPATGLRQARRWSRGSLCQSRYGSARPLCQRTRIPHGRCQRA